MTENKQLLLNDVADVLKGKLQKRIVETILSPFFNLAITFHVGI